MSFYSVQALIDRVLIISWLLKDFGWMMTSPVLAYTAGAVSFLMHFILFWCDSRKSYRYYNSSLLCWIAGNYVWMTTELSSAQPSTHIHFGARVPTGGIGEHDLKRMILAKSILFFAGAGIQLIMFIGIYFRCIPMPEDDEEDAVSRNEALIMRNSCCSSTNKQPSVEEASLDEFDDFSLTQDRGKVTLVFIENMYIICWICKDISWSWGTGDVTAHPSKPEIISFEALGILFGGLALFNYVIVSYLHRRSIIRFFDCITTLCWIGANFAWMAGEYFIRYQNLEYDDLTEGNDTETRITSCILFLIGIAIQVCISLYLLVQRKGSKPVLVTSIIELTGVTSPFSSKMESATMSAVSSSVTGAAAARPSTQGFAKLSLSEHSDDEVSVMF